MSEKGEEESKRLLHVLGTRTEIISVSLIFVYRFLSSLKASYLSFACGRINNMEVE